MSVDWRDVYSSHVNRVGFDPEAQELLAEWDSGRVSAYEGVPYEKFESVARSWSVGKALHEMIKPSHTHRYVK